MPYIQRSAPTLNTLEDVRAWVEDELGYIEQAQHDTLVLELKPSFTDIDKPREGMIVYADGVHFNPGLGAGSYEYRAGTWHKLAEDLSGTVATNTANIATNTADIATNTAAIAGPTAVSGFTNGSNAAAGKIGEYQSSFVLVGAAISAPDSVDVQVTSLTLTAGDWDLWGEIFFVAPAGQSVQTIIGAINVTVNSNPAVPADGVARERLNNVDTAQTDSLNGLRTRVNITSSTTYLLIANASYTAGTGTVYGGLRARRMR